MYYVEYIQNGTNISGGKSTGWMISFNRYPTTGTMVEIKFNHQNSTTDGSSFFGCHHYDGSPNYFRFFTWQTDRYAIDSPTDGNARLYVPFQFGQIQTAQITPAPNVSITNVDTQATQSQTYTSATPNYKYPMSIWYGFDGDTGNVVEGTRVYYIKIYENNTLVMDLWPAVDNGIAGFYDKIGNYFYHNDDTTKQYVVGQNLSSIVVSASKTVLAATGETINIVVNCENAWAVTGNTWLTLSSTGGTGSTTITATAPDYSTGTTARTDTITFTDTVTGDEAELTIKQKRYTSGQPVYLGGAEVTELYLGGSSVSEAYLGDVLVFSTVTPIPTGGTRSIQINNIPTPTFVEYNAGMASVSIDDGNNYIALTLEYTDPVDSSSYQETLDDTGVTGITATFSNGVLTATGDWGNDIMISYTISDPNCGFIPEGEDTEQISFVGNTIVTSFPTPETDLECECTNQGGEWDAENEECIMSECAGFDSQEECDCVHGGGVWIVPEIGDPYCEQQSTDCEGDPQCLCEQGGGTWVYDEMTDTYYCDCEGNPECECVSAGGEWDDTNQECTYPE